MTYWIQLWDGARLTLDFAIGARFEGGLSPRALAEHLSKVNRFCGATCAPYSVAQHCVLVANILRAQGHGPRLQLLALLHDAPEAFAGDVPRPIKQYMGAITPPSDSSLSTYDQVETDILIALCNAFGVQTPSEDEWGLIHAADNIALAAEARDLLPGGPLDDWHLACGDPSSVSTIAPRQWFEACADYVNALEALLNAPPPALSAALPANDNPTHEQEEAAA